MKRIWKVLGIISGVIVIGAGSLMLVLPTIISSNWGQKTTLAFINQRIPGHLNIDKLSISWFGSQSVHGFELKDPEGRTILTFDSFQTDSPLWQFLLSKPHIGETSLDLLNAVIYQDDSGLTNIQQALSARPRPPVHDTDSTTTQIPLPFRGNINVNDSSIKLMPFQGNAITISNLNAHLNIPKETDTMNIRVEGLTKQNQMSGNFEVDVAISGFGKGGVFELTRSDKGLPQINSEGEITLKAKVNNLPVDVIDQLVSIQNPALAGLIRAALGEKLDLSLDKTMSSEGILLQGVMTTPTTEFHLDGKVSHDGVLTLVQPAMLRFTVTPEFVQQAAKQNPHIQLPKSTQAEFVLDQLVLPLNFSAGNTEWLDSSRMQFMAYANLQPTDLLIKETRYSLPNTSVVFKYSHDVLTMQGHGEIKSGAQTAGAQLEGKIDHPFGAGPFSADVQLEFANMPIGMIENLFMPGEELLTEALGSAIHGKLEWTNDGVQNYVNVVMNSKGLSIPGLKFAIGDRIALKAPATIVLNLTPGIVERFGSEQFQLDAPSKVSLQLRELSFPNPSEGEIRLDQVYALGDLSIDSLSLRGQNERSGLYFSEIRAQLEGDSLASAQATASANMQWQDKQSLLAKAWGPTTRINASAKVAGHDDNLFDLDDIRVAMQSDSAKFKLHGRLKNGEQFALTEPAALDFTLNPETFHQMDLGAVRLLQPVAMQFIIDRLQAPLNDELLAQLDATGKLYMDNLSIEDSSDGNLSSSLTKLDIPWKISGPDNSITLGLSAKTSMAQQPQEGHLSANATLNQWQRNGAIKLGRLIVDARASLHGLPVSILGVLTGKQGLNEVLGRSLDVELLANFDTYKNAREKTGGKLEFKLSGDQLHGNAILQISDAITLHDPSNPATLQWMITPEKFAALRKLMGAGADDKLILTAPALFEAKMTEFNLPWLDKVNDPDGNGAQYQLARLAGLEDMGLNADILMNKVAAFNKQYNQKILFNKIEGHLSSPRLFNETTFNFSAEEADADKPQGTSILALKGKIANPFTPAGAFNFDGLSMDLHANANQLPIVMICSIACLDPQIQEQIDAFIGDTLDLKINAKLQNLHGFVNVDMKGNNGKLNLDGQITKGILTLNKPLVAEIAVNEKLSKSLMHEIIPFLNSAVSSERPVTIQINPDGFEFPLRPFNLTGIKMNRGIIDLGKIQFRPQEQLGQILSLLRITDAASAGQINVWFTPLYIGMLNGVVKLERMDMLVAEVYPMAIWGKVDFPKDRVRLNIGLGAGTLYNAFGVKGLKDEDMLVLPLTGTLDNASIDKAKATTKITALVAQSQGGAQGLLLGGVLSIIGGGLGDDNVPEPTTRPLPWKGAASEEMTQPPSKKEKALKNPFKQIEKEASSLLNIFK